MKRHIAAGSLLALSTVALAGCFGGDSTETVTATEAAPPATTAAAPPATTAAAPATTAAAQPPAAPTLTPPSGAKQLQAENENGAEYTRYSIGGTSPSAVVSGYESQLTSEGYSITSSGGGGGGWGKWGGAESGVDGNNGTTYVSVQAGGQSGSTTYFEVCVGPSQSSVNDCENASDGPDSNSKQS
jgi:hypothetical protein